MSKLYKFNIESDNVYKKNIESDNIKCLETKITWQDFNSQTKHRKKKTKVQCYWELQHFTFQPIEVTLTLHQTSSVHPFGLQGTKLQSQNKKVPFIISYYYQYFYYTTTSGPVLLLVLF